MTIDGFAAGPNGENDWAFVSGPDEAGFQKIIDLAASSDTLLAGRKLAQGFMDHWQKAAESPQDSPQKIFGQLVVNMRKIVFTRSGAAISATNAEVENRDLATVVQELKSQPGRDIIVYGGIEFARSLISLNLIDEYYIIVNPVAIGQGLGIFQEQKVMKLESSMSFKNSKVLNKYLPV